MPVSVLGIVDIDVDVAKPVVLIADGGTIGNAGHEDSAAAFHHLPHMLGVCGLRHHDVDINVGRQKLSIADDAQECAIAQPPVDAGGVECLAEVTQIPERLRRRQFDAVLDGAKTLPLRFGNVILLDQPAPVDPVAGFRSVAHMASSRTRSAMRLMISLDDRPLR